MAWKVKQNWRDISTEHYLYNFPSEELFLSFISEVFS